MKNNKKLPKKSGIYKFVNLINGAVYIGQSRNIYNRINNHHIYDYKNEKDDCYNTKFYQGLRKFGLDNFEVYVEELCSINELNEKEKYYIKKYNSYEHGYNSTLGGQSMSQNLFIKETELKRACTRKLNKSLQAERHPRAKLSNEEVILVRQRYIDGESVEQIYEDYKHIYLNQETFKRIIFGQTYKTVGNIPEKHQIRYTNAKFTDSQIREIRKLKKNNPQLSCAKIGKQYGVSGGTIQGILSGRTYKHVD